MVSITIRSFAMIREIIGQKTINYQVDYQSTIYSVIVSLCEKYPKLRHYLFLNDNLNPEFVIAVNKNRLNPDELLDTLLRPGDEIAIIPPAGGG